MKDKDIIKKQNDKLDENDINIEEEEEMAKKRRKGFVSDRQRKAVMSKIKKSGWITKSYDKGIDVTFYIPKIKIPKAPKFPTPKYPLYPKQKKRTKK